VHALLFTPLLWTAVVATDGGAGQPPSNAESNPVPLVVLDAGHGGDQGGATGVCGVHEKDISLAIVLELEKLLAASGKVRTLLTRRGDEAVALEERARIANLAHAALFLSVHANAAPGPSSHGVESFFVSRKAADKRIEQLALLENEGVTDHEPNDTLGRILDSLQLQASAAESQRLAALVQDSVSARLSEASRGVLQAPFYVLRRVNMASVLVEVGFLTNADECRLLADPTYQRKLAQALTAAVLAHFWTNVPAMAAAPRVVPGR